MAATGDVTLQPPMDGISALSWAPDSKRLAAASWDSHVHVYDVPNPVATRRLEHPAAVLSVGFGSSRDTLFSGSLDRRVREWNLGTGEARVLGAHDDAVSTMAWIPEHNLLVTGSWDKTIKVWDPSAADEPLRSSTTMPERVYNISYTPATGRVLVSMAHRHVQVYTADELVAAAREGREAKSDHSRESALKLLTRTVACMADGKGWASASIEGRIAVEYFDPDPAVQAGKYAFRAHRVTVDGVEQVYPINALAYHPVHNTFASGGSDGVLSVWDHSAKKRMRLYPKYPSAISTLAFSPDGTRLAIGVSYEYDNAVPPAEQGNIMLLLKETVMDDCKPKARA